MSKDMVKRPDHYCFSKFEPKDVIREWGLNFNLGSAVKYLSLIHISEPTRRS